MQRLRFWIVCILGALLLISGLMFFSTHYFSAKTSTLKNMLPQNVDMRLNNLILSETGGKDRNMTVNATWAQYYKTQDYFVLEKVEARVMTSQGDYVIKAQKGQYEPGSKILKLSGATRTGNSQGQILESEVLLFNMEEGFLESPGEFCLNGPSLDLDGTNFIFYTADKRLLVAGPVNLVLEP